MGEAEAAARRRDRLPRARPLRRLRRAVRPPVGLARAARRRAQRRRALLDRPPRHRAAVLQAGRRRARRAPALAGGGRGDPARARRRARRPRCSRTDARARRTSARRAPTRTTRCVGAGRRRPSRSRCRRVAAVVAAVQDGEVERGLVPLENSREGAVGATLDALVFDAPDVVIVGELVHRVTLLPRRRRSRIGARRGPHGALAPAGDRPVRALPARAAARRRGRGRAARPPTRCARWPRAARSRAPPPHAAIGTRHAARLYGAVVLAEGIEDDAGQRDPLRVDRARAGDRRAGRGGAPGTRTALVFWGGGDRRPGLARRLPDRVLLPRHQPHADRVAAAADRARPLHVLLRPGGRGCEPGGGRRDRRPARRIARPCGCSDRSRPRG